MNQFITVLIVGLALSRTGCLRHVQAAEQGYALVMHEVALTSEKPTAHIGQYTIKLLSIAEDGTTRIKVLQTDTTLSALPGQCFVSYEFGKEGLRLLSASRTNGTVKMTSRGCIRR